MMLNNLTFKFTIGNKTYVGYSEFDLRAEQLSISVF